MKMERGLSNLPDLSLPLRKYAEKIRVQDGRVWDPTRRRWLEIEPEEIVRQSLILFLSDAFGVSPERMKSEQQILSNRMKKRLDLVIYDREGKAALLAECKSWDVPLSAAVMQQVGTYNLEIKAPYLLVTNGEQSLLSQVDFKQRKSTFIKDWSAIKI